MSKEIESKNDKDLEKLKKIVQFYSSESLRLKNLIDDAKTKYKKHFYKKKLKDNNNIFSKYLYLYDKISNKSDKPDNTGKTLNKKQ